MELEIKDVMFSQSDAKVLAMIKSYKEKGLYDLKRRVIFNSEKYGFDSKKFHEKVDSKAPIVIFIRLESGLIIGGFQYRGL